MGVFEAADHGIAVVGMRQGVLTTPGAGRSRGRATCRAWRTRPHRGQKQGSGSGGHAPPEYAAIPAVLMSRPNAASIARHTLVPEVVRSGSPGAASVRSTAT